MSLIQNLMEEMESEAAVTRKMLSRIPNDKFDWRPHPKSMTVRELATHLAEIPSWIPLILNTSELDLETAAGEPMVINSNEELQAFFEKSLGEAQEALGKATEVDFAPTWTIRAGDTIYDQGTKGQMIRKSYSQIVHHRAQMGVFLRLNDIPIPASYGNSADEM